MDKKIDFSIIIPCGPSYNKELAETCFRSALGQDYQGNYEIVIIKTMLEDGAKDPFLEEKVNQNPNKVRIHYFFVKPLKGRSTLGENREHGVKLSKGEYLTFLDIDDFLLIKALSIIKKYSDEKKYDVISSRALFRSKYNRIFTKNKVCSGVLGDFFKRSFIGGRNIVFPTANLGQDILLKIQIMIMTQNKKFIDECVYFYYYNKSSVSNQIDRQFKRSVQEFLDVFDAFFKTDNFKNGVDGFYNEIRFFTANNWVNRFFPKSKEQEVIGYVDHCIVDSFFHSIKISNLNIRLILNYFLQMRKTRLKKRFNKRLRQLIKQYFQVKKQKIEAKLKSQKAFFKFLLTNPRFLVKTVLRYPFALVVESENQKDITVLKDNGYSYVTLSQNNLGHKILFKKAKEIFIEGFDLPLTLSILQIVKEDIPFHFFLKKDDLDYLKNVQEIMEYYPLERIKSITFDMTDTNNTVETAENAEEIKEAEVECQELFQKLFVNAKVKVR